MLVFKMKPRSNKCDLSKDKSIIKCNQCDYTSDRSSNLRRHKASLHQAQSIMCCGMVFTSKYEMIDHRSTMHKGALTCPYCQQVFNLFASYSRHIKNHDPTVTKYICSKCNRYTTTSKFNLQRHTASCGNRKRRSSIDTVDDFTEQPLDLSEPLDLSVRSSPRSLTTNDGISSEDSLHSHDSFFSHQVNACKRKRSAPDYLKEKNTSSIYAKPFISLPPTAKPLLNHFTRYAIRFMENEHDTKPNDQSPQEDNEHQVTQNREPSQEQFMSYLGLRRKIDN